MMMMTFHIATDELHWIQIMQKLISPLSDLIHNNLHKLPTEEHKRGLKELKTIDINKILQKKK